jgi:hypothetical protein
LPEAVAAVERGAAADVEFVDYVEEMQAVAFTGGADPFALLSG